MNIVYCKYLSILFQINYILDSISVGINLLCTQKLVLIQFKDSNCRQFIIKNAVFKMYKNVINNVICEFRIYIDKTNIIRSFLLFHFLWINKYYQKTMDF